MTDEDFVHLIFEDRKDVEVILDNPEVFDIHESMLKYGLSTKKFLYLDYKGEQYQEIVNFILDYEFNHNIELAAQEELEELGDFEYELLPDKIRETNKVISKREYGLFSFPTSGDFYALFITKLKYKLKLLQVDILVDESIPMKERFIQYYD
ncbi:hypothetical protein YDYSY3_32190 [Paenibacillus chitinolyticus]|uniref:hypothetical protein n=1 Tax=Paenibacillus chitinolyticus TaxID=79263 RepID=UPI0026E4F884|nr:hypothetical protein [Paenibacillus chitinolyticus]GKS12219.1 hypothetical protein YDYSY3_32190 [Paenibacillus chitinolyticus]